MLLGETIGKYLVIDRIGRGGMGTVYLAHDNILDRDVAIKVLHPELSDAETTERFRAEAVTAARLNHPGIATVHELFQHGNEWLMVMEYVRGETLEDIVTKKGSLPAEQLGDVLDQALAALAHAHRMGVVHRDLKPVNLMLTAAGVVKIMDFGIARVTGSVHMTRTGLLMGTPAYMAPEQVMGGEIDPRTDLYAMGVVLYRLATGKLPFKGDTAFAMAQSQVNDNPTPVHLSREGVPAWVAPLVERALSKSPEKRFQNADEFRQALKRGISGLPVDPDVTQLTPAFAKATADRPAACGKRTAALVVLAASVVVVGVSAFVVWSRSRKAAPPPSLPAPAAPASAGRSAAPPPAEAVVVPPVVTTPPVVAAPARKPAPPPKKVFDDPLVTFQNVQLLTVDGRKGKEQDVVLTLVAGQISVAPKKGGAAIKTLAYPQLVRATYAHAHEPRWDPAASAPPSDLDVPGGLFGGGVRHWLTLQSATDYLIVHLEDENWRQILDAIEARTGLKIARPSSPSS